MAASANLPSGTTLPRGLNADSIRWPLVPARDLFELKYGKALVEANRRPGSIPVYGTNGRCGSHDQVLFAGPGVILGRKGQGPLGVEWCDGGYWVIDTAYSLALIRTDIHLKYAYFLIKFIGLNHLKDGTSNPSLSRDTFGAQALPVPPLAEQRAIAHILGTLDDKNELNTRMNETLEALARALFKSWFVDFDPVRAKAEGRDPGLPQPLADLFPDRFEDSELGEIPAGWAARSIYDIADVVYGAPFSSSLFNADGFGEPLIRIRDLASESPGVWTPEMHPKGYKVKGGDIVVGMDGEFRAYLWGGPEAWLNQRVCVFVPRAGRSAAFVRNSIIDALAHVEATETATTVIHLGKSDIDRFIVVVPSPKVLALFNRLCQPWYDRIVAAKFESRSLAVLRDTLLPKLVSGEKRVKDVERFVSSNRSTQAGTHE